jgi:hypothetical protein
LYPDGFYKINALLDENEQGMPIYADTGCEMRTKYWRPSGQGIKTSGNPLENARIVLETY